MTIMNKEQVLKILPHREPFIFIDSVDSIEIPGTPTNKLVEKKNLAGGIVKANYFIKEDHPIFQGHFPGNPILPGVIQIEMMAQASCFIICRHFENPMDMAYDVALLKVEQTKFRKPIYPNTHLKIQTHCLKIRGPMMTHSCEITSDGELMSEATIFASLLERAD